MTTYNLTERTNGGYAYTMTVSNSTFSGWRLGTKEEVEKYLCIVTQNCEIRASGRIPCLGQDGVIRSGLTGKRRKKKVELEPDENEPL